MSKIQYVSDLIQVAVITSLCVFFATKDTGYRIVFIFWGIWHFITIQTNNILEETIKTQKEVISLLENRLDHSAT